MPGHWPGIRVFGGSRKRTGRSFVHLCKTAEICVYTARKKKNRTSRTAFELFGFGSGRLHLEMQHVEDHMTTKRNLYLGVAAVAIALAFGVAPTPVMAQQAATVSIGATDIGGVGRGPNGPEAGGWVIAETTGLPTKMNKTVVTDNQGRDVMP